MPEDRYYGIAAAEVAEQRPDRDLFARAYAIALGDPEKTKAVYIGIRAERLQEEADVRAQREAERKRVEAQKEKERLQREKDAQSQRTFPQKLNIPTPQPPQPKVQSKPPCISREPTPKATPPQPQFYDPEIERAVKAMREALDASKFSKG